MAIIKRKTRARRQRKHPLDVELERLKDHPCSTWERIQPANPYVDSNGKRLPPGKIRRRYFVGSGNTWREVIEDAR